MHNSLRRLSSRFIMLAVILPLLVSCASSVRTQLNTFTAPEANFGEGTIAVRPADEQLESSLEYGLYRSKVEAKLQEQGYQLAPPEEARYIARLGYSVEEMQRGKMRHPDFVFTTGFGHYYRRTGVGFVVNDRLDYEPEFLRRISLNITRTPEQQGGEPRRVYEVTALSTGSCPIMSVVFDEMLAATFQDFPGANGEVKTVTVRGEGNCR